MTTYRHTQIGQMVIGIVAIPVIVLIVVILTGAVYPVILGTVALLLICMFLFGSLTVEVTTDAVRMWFGPGLIRRTFPLSKIRSARAVRNKWYCGWGLRQTGSGWLYNVSGLDAVELELTDGERCRIGTDRPQELENAIRAVASRKG